MKISLQKLAVGGVFFALIAASVACGDDSGPKSGGVPDSSGPGASVRSSDLPPNLSAYQHALLDDGLLTASEYEKAALDVVRCHKENGAQVVGTPHYSGEDGVPEPWWTPRGQYMYGPVYADTDLDASSKYFRCEEQYFNVVNAIWTNYIAPSASEMQEARVIVARCLREGGIDVPEQPSTAQLAPITSPRRRDPEVARCLRLGADHIGMPAFIA